MIQLKEFPNRTFATKEEAFYELKKHEKLLIDAKKAEIVKSVEKGLGISICAFSDLPEAVKSFMPMEDGMVYAAINSTKWLDSHRDVHFDGIWKKSISETKGKIGYYTDHELKIANVIVWPKDVDVYTKMVPWSAFGKSYEGETEVLFFAFAKDKMQNEAAIKALNEKRDVKNSVRMQYVKIRLGMKSFAKGDEEYLKYYNEKLSLIANKEEVEELGYFWGIEEAKIVLEGSMVIAPSNEVTGVFVGEEKSKAANIGTLNNEPPSGTQEQKKQFFNHLIL